MSYRPFTSTFFRGRIQGSNWEIELALSRELRDRIAAMGANFTPSILAESRSMFMEIWRAKAGIPRLCDLSYGKDARQVLDIYGCTSGSNKRPVLIYVPGGGFTGGNKDDGVAFYRNIGEYFAQQGLICVVPNYRLAPAFSWPAGGEDVVAVVQWCAREIAHYGGDPARIYLSGQSAGATHAATALFRFDLVGQSTIRGVILINGLYDATDTPDQSNFDAYFGERSTRGERSPLTYVRSTEVPILLVLTEFDPPFLASSTYRLADSLTQTNRKSPNFLWLKSHNHVSCVYAIGSEEDELGPEMLKFIAAIEAAPTVDRKGEAA